MIYLSTLGLKCHLTLLDIVERVSLMAKVLRKVLVVSCVWCSS